MEKIYYFIILYFAVISIVAVFITFIDKKHAIKKLNRISEKTLITFALLGGAFAMYVTMKIIRHKTLHIKFMLGLPLIILIHTIIFLFLYLK